MMLTYLPRVRPVERLVGAVELAAGALPKEKGAVAAVVAAELAVPECVMKDNIFFITYLNK